ncbi:trypsin-like serine peptidase [Salinispora vitiensis]|uniref:trypsin-like serine peptidase n=1 Tax=Salinispora vitiensis TaxID=999544 RepID=UPI0013A5A196|nr:hypothetical protein [Salinispora vitiensis]
MKPPLRWSAAAGITLALIATAPVNANPAPTTTDPDSIASSVALTNSNRMVASDETINEVIEYWTPERMNNATPLEVEWAPTATRQAPQPDGPPTIVSSPVPPSTTHNRNNAINTRSTAVGKLFFVHSGIDRWCSASTITSPKGRLIFTTGSCLHSGPTGEWHSNIVFVPAYDNGKEPHGKWPIVHKHSFKGWTVNGKAEWNVGFAETATINGKTVKSQVGAHGFVYNWSVERTTRISYPYNNGQEQVTCEDNHPDIHSDPDGNIEMIEVECDSRAQGGGPFLHNLDAGSNLGYIIGVAQSDWGPYFDADVKGLYDAAEKASDG